MKELRLRSLPEPSVALQAVVLLLMLLWAVWLLARDRGRGPVSPDRREDGPGALADPVRPWPQRPQFPGQRDYFHPLPPEGPKAQAVVQAPDHLLGVVRQAGVWQALLERGGKRAWLKQGETWLDGWVLRSLVARKVVLGRGKGDGERRILRLQERAGLEKAAGKGGKGKKR